MQRHLSNATTISTFVKTATLTAAGLVAALALAAILYFAPAAADPSSAPDPSATADHAAAEQAAAAEAEQAAAAEAELAAAGVEAEATIGSAQGVLVSAATKVDTTALEASVTQLADYKVLSLDRVLELTDHTRSTTQATADAVASADAAQAAADEAAAAEAAAAEAAAAEAAAARANTPDGARALGAELAASLHGWGGDQFVCLDKLWTKESSWIVDADNPSSSAYGIPQALPGHKMASAGGDWATSARTQIVWGLDYIKSSYGSPCSAWSHSVAVNWY